MKYILFITLLICSLFGYAQNSSKQIDQKLLDLIIKNPKKYNVFSDSMQKILRANPKLKGWVSLYSLNSQLNYRDKALDSSLYYANIAITTFNDAIEKRSVDEEQLMRAYYFKGRILSDRKEYYTSTQNLIKSIEIGKKYNYKWIGFYTATLASNHIKVGDIKKALNTYLELVEDENYISIEGPIVFDRIGLLYSYLNEIDSAKYYYKKTLDLDNIISSQRATTFKNLGDLYYKNNEIDKSLIYFKRTDSIIVADTLDMPFKHANKGYLLMQNKQYNLAINSFKLILDDTVDFNKINREIKDLRVFAYDNLMHSYDVIGRTKLLLKTAKEKSTFLEKYNNQIFNEKITDLTVKHEVKEKDFAIQSLQEKNEIQNTILKQRNIIMWSIGILFLLMGILGYLFYRKRQVESKYKMASVEQRLLRSQLNPHFLFNALNNVVSLSSEKSDNTVPYTLKLSSLLRLILQNSREEFVPLEEELHAVSDYLELESNFSQKFTYHIDIDSNINIEEILIPPMFLQPFIENSILHGFVGKKNENINIQISIDYEKKTLHYIIIDNGKGINNEIKNNNLKHDSLSGNIIQERLTLYSKAFKTKAYFSIYERKEGGVKVDVYLPFLKDS